VPARRAKRSFGFDVGWNIRVKPPSMNLTALLKSVGNSRRISRDRDSSYFGGNDSPRVANQGDVADLHASPHRFSEGSHFVFPFFVVLFNGNVGGATALTTLLTKAFRCGTLNVPAFFSRTSAAAFRASATCLSVV
jgi:hypothetical protein